MHLAAGILIHGISPYNDKWCASPKKPGWNFITGSKTSSLTATLSKHLLRQTATANQSEREADIVHVNLEFHPFHRVESKINTEKFQAVFCRHEPANMWPLAFVTQSCTRNINMTPPPSYYQQAFGGLTLLPWISTSPVTFWLLHAKFVFWQNWKHTIMYCSIEWLRIQKCMLPA